MRTFTYWGAHLIKGHSGKSKAVTVRWPGIQHEQSGLNRRQDALQQHCVGPGKQLPLLSQILLRSTHGTDQHV